MFSTKRGSSTSSSALGKMRRIIGEVSEDLVDIVHRTAMQRGDALIEKIPNSWDVQRRLNEREVVCVPGVKTGVDYRGVLKGGRALYVECKHCSKPSFPLANIRDNQVDQLNQADDYGAACYLLVVWEPDGVSARKQLAERRFPGGPVLVALPWSVVRELKRQDASSIPTEIMINHARAWSFYAEGEKR
jgi:hypothetical protein